MLYLEEQSISLSIYMAILRGDKNNKNNIFLYIVFNPLNLLIFSVSFGINGAEFICFLFGGRTGSIKTIYLIRRGGA